MDAENVYLYEMRLQVVLRSHQIAKAKVPPPTLLNSPSCQKPLNLPESGEILLIDINSMPGIVIS
jgi:hypothetical protein